MHGAGAPVPRFIDFPLERALSSNATTHRGACKNVRGVSVHAEIGPYTCMWSAPVLLPPWTADASNLGGGMQLSTFAAYLVVPGLLSDAHVKSNIQFVRVCSPCLTWNSHL